MAKYLDNEGVLYLWNKIKAKFVVQESGKGLSTNDYTTTDKTKLNGIQEGAEVNVVTGATVLNTGGTKRVVEITKADGTTIEVANIVGNHLVSPYVLPEATTTVKGAMSKEDKIKLDGIAEGANNYTHPTSHDASMITQSSSYRFVTDSEKSTWNSKASTSVASASANGLMSSTMFSKLNALPTNATLQSTYALKSEITGMYKYKGSVTNESGLPTSATTGDVYNIVNASTYGGAGMNVVYTGTGWDALGEVFNIDSITNTELDTICV